MFKYANILKGSKMLHFIKNFFKKTTDFDFAFGDTINLPEEAIVNKKEKTKRLQTAKKKAPYKK